MADRLAEIRARLAEPERSRLARYRLLEDALVGLQASPSKGVC